MDLGGVAPGFKAVRETRLLRTGSESVRLKLASDEAGE